MKLAYIITALCLLIASTGVFCMLAEPPADDHDEIVTILTATTPHAGIDDPTTAMLMLEDGFIYTPLFEHSPVQDMIDFAVKHLGKPYRRAGKGPTGFDCSGFTSYVFGKFGYSLSPSSSAQYTQGKPIDIDMVQPGDLLFFSGRRISQSNVGHVAMVVDVDEDSGSVLFIHAANGGGIRYDRYPDTPYYRSRFIGARRMLTDNHTDTLTIQTASTQMQ